MPEVATVPNVLDEMRARKFDRLTFDPATCTIDKFSLDTLRSQGRARAYSYRNGYGNGIARDGHDEHHRKCCSSTGLRQLHLMKTSANRTFVDIGCGDSVDVLIAAGLGYDAHGVDLFPPSVSLGDRFIQADVVERIPFPDGSVYAVLSQAMIDLVEPDARGGLYAEVLRVLEPNGVFSQIGVALHCGHGFKAADELSRARKAGFRAVNAQAFGFVAVK